MKAIHSVGIVGLGLIGGSMARSIKKHTIATVYGYDLDPEAMALATDAGAIDAPLTRETLQECDILLIAIAPRSLVKWVEDHADAIPTTTILVDLCGVKRYIYKHIAPLARENGFLYVGGHPMAGKEVSGFANSDRELYRDASMILCPDESADEESIDTLKALKEIFPDDEFYLLIGADNWAAWDRWKSAEEIVRNHHVLVYPRMGYQVDIPSELAHHVALIDAPVIEISSTQVRSMLAADEIPAFYLPDDVLNYAIRHSIYR